jgi:hypothetical protein
MAHNEIRMSLLKRLAEQAMSDQEFRAIAGKDLDGALERYGYALNERERDLVGRFRTALEEAGVDLFLKDEIDLNVLFDGDDSSHIEHLLDRPGS